MRTKVRTRDRVMDWLDWGPAYAVYPVLVAVGLRAGAGAYVAVRWLLLWAVA